MYASGYLPYLDTSQATPDTKTLGLARGEAPYPVQLPFHSRRATGR